MKAKSRQREFEDRVQELQAERMTLKRVIQQDEVLAEYVCMRQQVERLREVNHQINILYIEHLKD